MLNEALRIHNVNRAEIDYLEKYLRGVQPILSRTKEVRPEITNKVVVNRAAQINEFKTSYLLGEPCQYISRSGNIEAVCRLNDYMTIRAKATSDLELAFWFHCTGVAYRMIRPATDDEAPIDFHILRPDRTFVVWWSGVEDVPVMGVYEVPLRDGKVRYCIYTTDRYFEVEDGQIAKDEGHIMGDVPIIEYVANDTRSGCFEPVIPILDAINSVESNRLDGLEQFVQAFMLFVNCDISREKLEEFKRLGAIKITSDQGNPSSVSLVSSELDQAQTQTLVDDLWRQARTIVGMPSQSDGDTGDSSNNGAVILRNGWQSAEAIAKQAEMKFRRAEKRFLRIALRIINGLGKEKAPSLSDIDMAFTRRNYTDLATKSQVLTSLLGCSQVHPKDAFAVCGMFSDSLAAYERGMAYQKETEAKRVREGTENTSQTQTSAKTEQNGQGRP